jgi:DNA repair exonuclease SbcCD nuclease subunit
MMNYVQSENIDLVLIAGDLFDCGFVHRDTLALLCARFSTLACPVVISPGNHDPYTPGSLYAGGKLPENVYLFTEKQPTRIDFPALDVSVTGYAFTSDRYEENPLDTPCPLHPKHINILLGHADLGAPLSKYAPLPLKSLEQSGFAYAALGHIHNAPPARRYGNTVAAYSGFLAGRGFDEPGAGGALFVEIEGRHVEMTRLESAADRFEVLSVDCTGAQKNEEVAERVRKSLSEQEFLPHTALRLRLIGEVGLSCVPDGRLPADLREGFSLLEVRDETLPILDSGYLEKDPTLRGAFYRAMLPRLTATDDETRMIAARAFRMGLAALAGREV